MARSDSEKERDERAARNEAMFRRVNERLEEVNQGFQVITDNAQFVCECASIDCTEQIELTLPAYEAVRSVPTRFVIKPGHLLPDEERVIEQHGDYLVVEKVGYAGERASQLDPRSD
jgi:hypothetical protein